MIMDPWEFEFKLLTVVVLSELVLGIFEYLFLYKYNKLDSGCYQSWILITYIFDICAPLTIFWLWAVGSRKKLTILFYQVGQIIIGIWGTFVCYNINDSCSDYWTNSAPEFWLFIDIHYMIFWLTVLWISLVCALLYCNCTNRCKSNIYSSHHCDNRCCDYSTPCFVSRQTEFSTDCRYTGSNYVV